VLASFEDFVRFGGAPPQAFLRALAEAFEAYRQGVSMDKAFGVRRRRGGVQDDLAKREWERTNASMFAHLHEVKGLSVEETKASVSAFGPTGRGSEATVYRHYLKHKR
jgi:hypothetical protein